MSVKPRFIISDLHLGEGCPKRLKDADHQATKQFVDFFQALSSLGGVKVIINGDFIDFPHVELGTKSAPPKRFLGTTEAESTLRLQKVIAGHPDEFEALKKFLTVRGNQLLLIPGNHDVDFAWNRVLQTFMQRIGATPQNFRFGSVYKEGGVYVTHGHQYSDDNQINVPLNFTFNRLNTCWDTHFVEHFFNRLEDRYPLLNHARPMWKTALSAVLSDELLVSGDFAAELVMFLKNFRLPLQDYLNLSITDRKPKTRILRSRDIDNLTSSIKLDILREKLTDLREQSEFRREFDHAFYEIDDAQWERLCIPQGTAENKLLQFMQNTETRPRSRNFFAKTDNYQEAARYIARYHLGTRAVIMGHTHAGSDGTILECEGTQEQFQYVNTGTWTQTYQIPEWKLPDLQDLMQPNLYERKSGVVRCAGSWDNLSVTYFNRWHEALSG